MKRKWDVHRSMGELKAHLIDQLQGAPRYVSYIGAYIGYTSPRGKEVKIHYYGPKMKLYPTYASINPAGQLDTYTQICVEAYPDSHLKAEMLVEECERVVAALKKSGYGVPRIKHKDEDSITHNMVVHIRGPARLPTLKELCVRQCRQRLDPRECLFRLTRDLGEEVIDVDWKRPRIEEEEDDSSESESESDSE